MLGLEWSAYADLNEIESWTGKGGGKKMASDAMAAQTAAEPCAERAGA